MGALFIGPKAKGIFWPEELSTLQMVAQNVAQAVQNSALIQKNIELSDLDEQKKAFISNITHEFKSPLSILNMASNVLLGNIETDRFNPESAKKNIGMIQSSAARLGLFIQNLLEVAKIDSSKILLDRERCDLHQVLENAVTMFDPLAKEKGLKLTFKSEKNIFVDLDVEKMNQVFHNLIINAIKFTGEGIVEIGVNVFPEKVAVYVKDTGRGIDPKYINLIFDRFFQVPKDKGRNTKGTGLGLSIAKGWTEVHGGKIHAESAGEGKGTTFIVELPRAA